MHSSVEMLEVCAGLLLGSMGDALAVFTRAPSVVARHHVTHVLTLCNDPPEWIAREESATDGEPRETEEEEEEEKDSPVEAAEPTAQELEEEGGAKGSRRGRGRRRGRGQVELPKWRKFIEVADMPKSDLLHHFEECCQFIRGGRERGTVLIHCEHGVSRSVTVVLAYLMWSERRPLKTLYLELKERRPEIRPNSGFMDQLRLWEEMGCGLREDNKRYKAYRLQCKAREIEVAGSVAEVEMAPDPAASPVDAALYFRCRKCRQLLFTDRDVLQHQLGEGRRAFRRHRGSTASRAPHCESLLVKATQEAMEREGVKQALEERETLTVGGGEAEEGQNDSRDVSGSEREGEMVAESKKREDGLSEEAVLGGNPECLAVGLPEVPWDHTPSETAVSAIRREVGSVLAQRATHTLSLSSSTCTSYFIEPVAWMGEALLGHMDGKILCPKCNSRLGSFSWRGQQCSCGQWLTPAFQVHKSRVDEVRTLSRRKTAVVTQ